jgi:general secretion pathway protein H
VILSFARLSLGDGGAAARLEQDARTLAAALRLAHDEAVLAGREFGLRLAGDGYDFMQLAGKTWRPLTGRQPLRARRLSAGQQLTLRVDGYPVALEESLDGVDRPQVFLLSSGEGAPGLGGGGGGARPGGLGGARLPPLPPARAGLGPPWRPPA